LKRARPRPGLPGGQIVFLAVICGLLLLVAVGAVLLFSGVSVPEPGEPLGGGIPSAEAAGLDRPAGSAARAEVDPEPGNLPRAPFPDDCLEAAPSQRLDCLVAALRAADDDSVAAWLRSQGRSLETLELLFQALLRARPPGKALELADASGTILQGSLTDGSTETFLGALRRRAADDPAFRGALYERLRRMDLLANEGAAPLLALSVFADDPILRSRAEEVALGAAGTPSLGQWRGALRAAADPAAGSAGIAFLTRLLERGKFLPPAAWRILPARILARETPDWDPDRRLGLLNAFLKNRDWGEATAFLIENDREHRFHDLAALLPEKFAALRKQASARLGEEE